LRICAAAAVIAGVFVALGSAAEFPIAATAISEGGGGGAFDGCGGGGLDCIGGGDMAARDFAEFGVAAGVTSSSVSA